MIALGYIHETAFDQVENLLAENPEKLHDLMFTDIVITPLLAEKELGIDLPADFKRDEDRIRVRTLWKNKLPTKDLVIWDAVISPVYTESKVILIIDA